MSWGWEHHPSRKIIGEASTELRGRKIALGVTSSAAIYKSVDLARELMRAGAEVTVVMSSEATRLISPALFEWATGRPVYRGRFSGEVGHILLAETHDAILVAPATASTMAKLAHGIADTAVTLAAHSFLGEGKPVLLAPAMHLSLYKSMERLGVVSKLREAGFVVHEPRVEGNRAKFPDPRALAWHAEALVVRGKDLDGLRVLVTAGPTREYIDRVRFISNPSSGKMGVALAVEASYRGASVSLVHGPLSGIEHDVGRAFRVETTREMARRTLEELEVFKPNVVILAAAPTDFAPAAVFDGKLDSSSPINLQLVPTPKISREVAERREPGTILVLFAAEIAESEEELAEKAIEKKTWYGADVIVANNVGTPGVGFASDFNEVLVLYGEKPEVLKIERSPKRIVARRVLDVVKSLIEAKRG
ncbi:MAG: bifunctional phosphopantothenoylcysteine decarboxylase/phosphopantothenate--cysteine ligase CoaBC [Fervidicoccaceae archaeon]